MDFHMCLKVLHLNVLSIHDTCCYSTHKHLTKMFGQLYMLWELLNDHVFNEVCQFQACIPLLRLHHYLHIINKLHIISRIVPLWMIN
jgi:hypothetical protein